MGTTLKKNQLADVGKYSYKYTDIAQIHSYLEENNMSYYQYVDRIDGDDYIMTVKIKDGKELPALRGARIVNATLVGVKNPAQEQGSALTYARRYSLLMAFGLATEDDDAKGLTKIEEPDVNFVINFGKKHPGKTLKEIYEEDKGYIDWLYGSKDTDEYIKRCIELLDGEYKNIPKKLELLSEIKTKMTEKKILPNELYDIYGKKSNEMTLEELEDVIKWVNEYVQENE